MKRRRNQNAGDPNLAERIPPRSEANLSGVALRSLGEGGAKTEDIRYLAGVSLTLSR